VAITEEAHWAEYASIPMALNQSGTHDQAAVKEDGPADEFPTEVA